jgi:hypothetical protein
MLKRLLNDLEHEETEGRFTYSIVVCDNDQLQSAEAVVAEFASTSSVAIKYCVETQQNISSPLSTMTSFRTGTGC